MNTITTSHYFLAPATVRAGVIPVPLPRRAAKILLQIAFPDFDFRRAAPVTSTRFSDNRLTIKAAIDTDVEAILALTGVRSKGGKKFQPTQVSLQMGLTKEHARADFVASTFTALTGLAGQVDLQIPDIKLDLKLNFDLSLSEISQMLQRRQVAYRLMVIERATGKRFLLPPMLSGAEVHTIAIIYHAIVNRSVIEPGIEVPVPTTPEGRAWLAAAQLSGEAHPTPYLVPLPEPVSERLLGQSISLGRGVMIIEDGVIEHFDEVRRELERGDKHRIEAVIRSLTGQVRYELPEAPRLPDTPWDPKIQALIDLEAQLDARFAERSHALAAATLADLTEEEKKEVTARPEWDEDAFLVDDSNGENS